MTDKAREVADDYLSTLSDLTVNSKPVINALTFVAKENVEHYQVIVNVIVSHLKRARPEITLPVLYLIDSIVKNVGGPYRTLFENHIVHLFCDVFKRVDEDTRKSLHNLRQTWVDVFSCSRLRNLDSEVQKIDPAWPILTSIHVNPKFFDMTSKPAPVSDPIVMASTPQTAQEKMYVLKQKELAELQKRKIQLLQQSSVETLLKTVIKPSQVVAPPPIVAEVKPVSRDPRLKPSSSALDPRRLGPIPVIRTKDRQQQEQLALQTVQEQLKQLQQQAATLIQSTVAKKIPVPTPDLDISNIIPLASDNEYTESAITNKDDTTRHLSDLSKEPKSLTSSAHVSSPVKSQGKKHRRSKQPQQSQTRADGGDDVVVSSSTSSPKSLKKSLPSKKKDGSPSLPKKSSRSPPSTYCIPRVSSDVVDLKTPVAPSSFSISTKDVVDATSSVSLTEEEQSGSLIVSPPHPPHFKEIKSSAKGRNYMRRDKNESDKSPSPKKESVQEAAESKDEDLRASLPGPSGEKKEDLDLRIIAPVTAVKRQGVTDADPMIQKKTKTEENFDTLFGDQDVDLRKLTIPFMGRPPTPPPPVISGSESNDSWAKSKVPEKKERSSSEDRRDRERREERKRTRSDRERSPLRNHGKNSDERERSPSRGYGKIFDESKDQRRWNHEDDFRNNRRARELDKFDHVYENRRIDNYESAMKQAAEQLEKGIITKMQYNQRIQDCISRRSMNGPGPRWQNQPRPQPWALPPFGGPNHFNEFRHMGPWQNQRYFNSMQRPDFGTFHGPPGPFNQNLGPNPRMGMMGPNGPPMMGHMLKNPQMPLENPLAHMNNGGPMNNLNPMGSHIGGKFPLGHGNPMPEVKVPDLHFNQSIPVLPPVPSIIHRSELDARSPVASVATLPVAASAVPVLPLLDASEIYQKLLENGLIIAQGKKPEPEKKVVISFDNPESLKSKRSDEMLEKLYGGIPCSDCQLRFNADQVEELRNHKDWYFRKNRGEKAKNVHKRSFYYPAKDWCQYEEVEDKGSRVSNFFESQREKMEKENAAAENSSSNTIQPSVKCTVGLSVEQCKVCFDAFDPFYHDEKEEWHIGPAVKYEGENFHPGCLEDYLKNPDPIDQNEDTEADDTEDEKDQYEPETIVLEENTEPNSVVQSEDEDDDIQIIEAAADSKVVPEVVISDNEDDSLKSEVPKVADNDDLSSVDVVVKEEPTDCDDPDIFPKENDPEFEKLIATTVIDTTRADLVCTIDGNFEIEPPPMPIVPANIKINLTNPVLQMELEKTKEKTPEPEQVAIADVEEPLVAKEIKPTLQGRTLTVLDTVKKGQQATGMCTIM